MAFGRRAKSYAPKHDVRWLVAGLGNPGREYADTPHNVGFLVVEALAAANRIALVPKHDGMFGVGRLGATDGDVALLAPLTYMNLSGRSVRPALMAVGLDAESLLVVHDEIDLPFGKLQLKFGGGFAGHNGLKSINEMLGTREFARLRVGVGRPGPGDRRPVRDWILSKWDQSPAEVEQLTFDSVAAVEQVVERGVRRAMNVVNERT